MPKSPNNTATELLHLKPYKYTVALKLQGADSAWRLRFCTWFCERVCRGEVDQLLTYFTDKTCFQSSGHINNKHKRYRQ